MGLPLNVLALERMPHETVSLQCSVKTVFSQPRPPVKQGGVFQNLKNDQIFDIVSMAGCELHALGNRKEKRLVWLKFRIRKFKKPPVFQMKNCLFFRRGMLSNTRPHLCPGCCWSIKQCSAVHCLVTCLIRTSLIFCCL